MLGVEGNHIDLCSQMFCRIKIVESSDDNTVGNLRSRTSRRWIEDHNPIAHSSCRQGEHSPKLTATENADGSTR
jgi:hypothetical protein